MQEFLYNITNKLKKLVLFLMVFEVFFMNLFIFKSFFELMALGAASGNKNSWIWEGFPEIFVNYFEVYFIIWQS